MVFLGVVFVGVILVLCVCTALLRWNEVKYRKKGLPPGTMGWPVFGETTEFLKQGPSFMKNQRARYGSLFRSHILGCPTVVSMDPELNRYILMNEGKGLLPGYPQSMLICDKRLESQQYFLMFGGGSRQCSGKELGIVEITTFIHYFVTRYRWEEVGGDTLLKFPRVKAPNGLHLRVWNY